MFSSHWFCDIFWRCVPGLVDTLILVLWPSWRFCEPPNFLLKSHSVTPTKMDVCWLQLRTYWCKNWHEQWSKTTDSQAWTDYLILLISEAVSIHSITDLRISAWHGHSQEKERKTCYFSKYQTISNKTTSLQKLQTVVLSSKFGIGKGDKIDLIIVQQIVTILPFPPGRHIKVSE